MSPRQEAVSKIVDKFLLDIREFADSAQVLVSFENDDNNKDTAYMMQGTGNVYSRLGLARQYLIMDDQRTRRHCDSIDSENNDSGE